MIIIIAELPRLLSSALCYSLMRVYGSAEGNVLHDTVAVLEMQPVIMNDVHVMFKGLMRNGAILPMVVPRRTFVDRGSK